MFNYSVWVLGLALLGLLLFRAVRGKLLEVYPMFYLYLGFVLAQSLSLLVICLAKPKYYAPFYWYAEFFSMVLGCLVVWEIYRRALGCFPGASRMASNMLLFILLMAISKILANTWNGSVASLAGTLVELERNLRTVQAAVLIGLMIIIVFYRIPLGQNLWGMMLGYGLFIGSSVMILALRVLFGNAFQSAWLYLQPLFYVGVSCIWCVTLWSYKAAPVPKTEPGFEQDYKLLAGATKRSLLQARAYLGRAMRP